MSAMQAQGGDKASRTALRLQLINQGCSVDDIAAEFRSRWGFGTLAAYRHAAGLSQGEAASLYSAADESRPATDYSLISKLERWPGPGSKAPTIYNLVLLAQVYNVEPHRLVAGADLDQLPARDRIVLTAMRPQATAQGQDFQSARKVETHFGDDPGHPGLLEQDIRPLLRQLPSLELGSLPAHLLESIDRLRRSTDDVLSAGTVTGSRMELIEDAVEQLRRDHIHDAPNTMLAALLTEFVGVVDLTKHSQTAQIRIRLAGAAAQLATLTADSLMKLGETTDSHRWYRTARLAGDDTHDNALRAQIRAQEAMLPYYYGDLPRTIRLAQEAQNIAGDLACAAACLAAAAEGRAWARLGDHEKAELAMGKAQDIFNRLPDPDTTDAFSFPERRLLLYLSGALTYLGEPARAEPIQDRALALYSQQGAGFTLDPTLIQLDRAAGLAGTDAVGACELTQETLEAVPAGHRTQIVLTRGTDVLSALPRTARALPAAADLREMLALTAAP
ncbi:helix-turn-helix domain-containing protein [Kribbella sp. DT2]|uniref:helix-turn-helix domain-containing protein n=1 Tax=Kribbella sp. DT2 TaxID=3393427 RepID=UPI003CF23D40